MTAMDIFDAASEIANALGATMPNEQVVKAIKMALVAIGKEGLMEEQKGLTLVPLKPRIESQ